MPIFRHVGGSVVTERGDAVPIEQVRALAISWRVKAGLGEYATRAIYAALADNAETVVAQVNDWNRAAAGAPL